MSDTDIEKEHLLRCAAHESTIAANESAKLTNEQILTTERARAVELAWHNKNRRRHAWRWYFGSAAAAGLQPGHCKNFADSALIQEEKAFGPIEDEP